MNFVSKAWNKREIEQMLRIKIELMGSLGRIYFSFTRVKWKKPILPLTETPELELHSFFGNSDVHLKLFLIQQSSIEKSSFGNRSYFVQLIQVRLN